MTKLLFTLAFTLFCLIGNAQTPFVKGKKYRIESNFDKSMWMRDGAFGVGANQGVSSSTQYVIGKSNFTADCWWYIEEVGNALYTIKNASTGQYLTIISRDGGVKLTDAIEEKSKLRICFDESSLLIYYNSGEPIYLYFDKTSKDENATDRALGTYRKESTQPFYYYNFYDESGNKIDPMSVPGIDYASSSPKIHAPYVPYKMSDYIKDLTLNGKAIAFAEKNDFFLATMPTGNLNFEYTATSTGATVELRDGDNKVTSASGLSTTKEYSLVIVKDGTVKKSYKLYFTTLPVITIQHEGTITTGMSDYVWGAFQLNSPDQEKVVSLNARFKSRGATGSKFTKRGITMKIRELGTDAEVDTTLLNIRSCNNWVLDGAPVDVTCMRNRVGFDIWNQFSKLPHNSDFNGRTGAEGKFVELIINDSYNGIYSLNDRINRKLLNLKKPDDLTKTARGLLVKDGLGDQTTMSLRGKIEFISRYGDTRNTPFWYDWELKTPEEYPSIETWSRITELYDHEDDINYYKNNFIWQTNVVDYHLFIMALMIIDNGNKNEYMAIKNMQSDSSNPDHKKFFFIPWDLDTGLGGDANLVNKDGNYNTTGVKQIKGMRINQNYPFSTFLKDSDYFALMKARWLEARTNQFSFNNVIGKMSYYANLFVSSGAYARQLKVNNNYVPNIKNEVSLIGEWYAKHMQSMDDFFGVSHLDPSGIDAVNTDKSQSQVFDLQGRMVSNPQKGIYIKNGKKYLVK